MMHIQDKYNDLVQVNIGLYREIERLEAELAWSNKVCMYYGRLLSEQGIVPDHLEVSDDE